MAATYFLCNCSNPPPPPRACIHGYLDTYTIVRGGGGGLPTNPHPWIPPHTTQLQGDLPTPLTHNNTQHYTTALGYIKLPMYQLFLWRLYIMVLRGATSWLGALEGVGPENLDFFGPKWLEQKKSWFLGPTPSHAPHNDVAPLKTIMYRAIKTTCTLIVILLTLWQQSLF